MYKAYWADGVDISDPQQLENLLRKSGEENAAELIRGTQQTEIKSQLFQNTTEAIEHGVCGVPTFRIDNELWWGQDRMMSVVNHLSTTSDKLPIA